MTDFRYDYDDDSDHDRAIKNQEQFNANYQQLMTNDPSPSNPSPKQTPSLILNNAQRKSTDKIQQSAIKKTEPKKEEIKNTPLPPSGNQSTKAKLVEQHLKLKGQLRELAAKMDEIVDKEKEKRRKKLNNNSEDEDDRVKELKSELRDQEIEISKNKAAIDRLRKNLDYKYDNHKITEKEDQLKLLKTQMVELEKERKYLEKITKEEKTSVNKEDKEMRERYDRMKSEIGDLTQKNKRLIDSINDKEKQIRKLHENFVGKEEKIKEIEAKISKSKKESPHNDDLEYAISQLEDNIKELELKKAEVEKEGLQRLRDLEKEKKRLKNQVQKRKTYLEEKEKELKINKIQYQDILRLINMANNVKARKEANDDAISKASQKRTINKGGREPPKMPPNQDQYIDEAEEEKEHLPPSEKKRSQKGVSANSNVEYAQQFEQYSKYTNGNIRSNSQLERAKEREIIDDD